MHVQTHTPSLSLSLRFVGCSVGMDEPSHRSHHHYIIYSHTAQRRIRAFVFMLNRDLGRSDRATDAVLFITERRGDY